MIIRNAEPGDIPVVYDIHRKAFSASGLGHHGEAELVRALYSDGDMLCSLVAEIKHDLKGHILFSRMTVEADGKPLRAAGLAPVSVLPEAQQSGIGGALIKAGLCKLRAGGIQISFVVGHAEYYPRFGYRADLARPFESSFAGPHFMALYLDSALALPQKGRAEYAPAFARMG